MGKSDFAHIGVTKRKPRLPSSKRPRHKAAAPQDAKAATSNGNHKAKNKPRKPRKRKHDGNGKGGAAAHNNVGQESGGGASSTASNWAKLQQKLGIAPAKGKAGQNKKKRIEAPALRHFKADDEKKHAVVAKKKGASDGGGKRASGKRYLKTTTPFPVPREKGPPTDIVAIDCEMVGVGSTGVNSALARVSIVNFNNQIVYDTFVRPPEKITDFRTKWSGVTPKMLKGARTFKKCQQEVAALLEGRVVVGHAVGNDFDALLLTHPKPMIRDTAHYRPLMSQRGKGTRFRPKALRKLASEVFGIHTFQQDDGGHDSIDDAAMSLELYKVHRHAWEKMLSKAAMRAEKHKAKKRAAVERRKQERRLAKGQKPTNDDDELEEDALFGY